jgi:hypothetical protein
MVTPTQIILHGGGAPGFSPQESSDRLVFFTQASETAALSPVVMPQRATYTGAGNSTTKGFITGGGNSSTGFRTNYRASFNVPATSYSVLPAIPSPLLRQSHLGSNPTHAFIAGGSNVSANNTLVLKMTFADDSQSTISPFPTSESIFNRYAANPTHMYTRANTSSPTTTIAKFPFATETHSNLPIGTSVASQYTQVLTSPTAAYFTFRNGDTIVDKFVFATDARSTITATCPTDVKGDSSMGSFA